MELTEKQCKILSSDKWYHATTMENFYNIRRTGVVADYNRGKELDFGYGFYLTASQKMAENYLTRLYKWSNYSETAFAILEYTFKPIEWFVSSEYTVAIFDKFDLNFAEFVFKNRIECKTQKQKHNYDVIYGVMSDSVPTQLILNYKAGDISKDDVLQGLQKGNSMKQLSIHNQTLCSSLHLSNVYEFNPFDGTRKEIEIYDE